MKRTISALVAGVILGSTGIAAATSHRTTGSLTYEGIRCVTAPRDRCDRLLQGETRRLHTVYEAMRRRDESQLTPKH